MLNELFQLHTCKLSLACVQIDFSRIRIALCLNAAMSFSSILYDDITFVVKIFPAEMPVPSKFELWVDNPM